MAILILNRFPARLCKFTEWLAPLCEELFLFTPDVTVNDFQDKGYAVVKGFDNYMHNGLIEIEALRLHQERPFRAVIALDESDILRAARLRERLGLPGQHVESATAFRDKVVMKTLLAPHVKCPAFARLKEPFDLHDFVEKHGLPVVVKPDDGMGSMNTHVIRTEEQLDALYRQGKLQGMMVETFVEGEMYLVDGLVVDHQLQFCSVGKYQTGCLSYQDEVGLLINLIPPTDPQFARFKAFVEKVLDVLPTPELTSIHCEVFRTTADKLVFCEIASRTAGARVSECIRQTYGIELDQAWTERACGILAPIPDVSDPQTLCATFLIPKQVGRVEAMIAEFPFDWVTEYQPRVKVGMEFKGGVTSIDTIGSVVFQGRDEEALLARFALLQSYIQEHVKWAPLEQEAVC
jgi:hypothetical protein